MLCDRFWHAVSGENKHNRALRRKIGSTLLVALAASLSFAVAPARAADAPATVRVLYPAALTSTLKNHIAPAFEKATGYKFSGHPVAASAVTSTVRAQADTADVLICANPRDNLQLIGLPNGGGVGWYLMLMQSPLVLGYSKNSKFAQQLSTKPWYEVAATPGFKLGVIDPNVDTKGQLIAEALHHAVSGHSKDKASQQLAQNSQLVSAPKLVQDLKTNAVDASFFYLTQAIAAGIPHASLHQDDINTTYTASILNHASAPKAASAFIAFLLSPKGQKLLDQNQGLATLSHPVIFGNIQAAPKAVRSAVADRQTRGD